MTGKELQLSAENITKVSFGSHAKQYEDAITRRRDIKRDIANARQELVALLDDYGIQEGTALTVYVKETPIDKDVSMVIDSQFGHTLMNLVVDPDVMLLLNKRFKGLGDFLERCHAAWQIQNGKRKPEVDKKLTSELKRKYTPIRKKIDSLTVELDTLNQNLDDVEKVVDFYDKVAKLSKYQKFAKEDK